MMTKRYMKALRPTAQVGSDVTLAFLVLTVAAAHSKIIHAD